MIARPRPAVPATTLPASLILTPREQKQYRRFQSQTSTLAPKNQGRLPTAVEYADFRLWLAKRDSGYLSDTPLADIAYYAERASQKNEKDGITSVCGHALHPTHTQKAERCPVCTVDVHITYMKVVTDALEAAGGLVKQRWEAADTDSPALQAWYIGKLAWLKELGRLEDLASKERAYATPLSGQATSEIKTATEALEMYWTSMEANPSMIRAASMKKAGTVGFCPETSFELGRDQRYFWRKSPRYEAGGKYSSSSTDDEDEEQDKEEDEASHESQNAYEAQSILASDTARKAVPLAHSAAVDEEDASDEEASDLEDEDSDEEEEDDEDEDEDEDETLDEDEEEIEVEGSFVVFEYEEVIVPGAEFVVFEE